MITSLKTRRMPIFYMGQFVPSNAKNSSYSIQLVDSIEYGPNKPNWKQLIKLGQDATTSMVGDRQTLQYVPGRYMYKTVSSIQGNREYSFDGVYRDSTKAYLFPTDPQTLSMSLANGRAAVSFVKACNSLNEFAQGGVILGELAKTIHGIRHPAQSLQKLTMSYLRSAKAVRRRWLLNRQTRIATEKVVLDLWLEHQFHTMPLRKDIADMMKVVKDRFEEKPPWVRVTRSATEEFTPESYTSTGILPYADYSPTAKQIGKVNRRTSVTYRGAVTIERSDPNVKADLKLAGFSWDQFAPTVWELVPWSFLIDYFTNIGDVITAWSFSRTALRWCNRTVWRECVREDTFSFTHPDLPSFIAIVADSRRPATVVSRWTRVERGSFSGSFVPPLELSLDLSLKQWVNVGALVASRQADRYLQQSTLRK